MNTTRTLLSLAVFGGAIALAGCDSVSVHEEHIVSPASVAAGEAVYQSEGFYFLPPMVGSQSYSGVFDAELSPVVEICASVACEGSPLASFSMSGTGSERVRVDEDDEHYIVNWHTRRTGAVAGDTYRLRVLVDGHVRGHIDVAVVTDGQGGRRVADGGALAVMFGSTLPVKFRIETGEGGGELGVLWDNGGIVTHPEQGAGGADVSMASVVPNVAGSNVRSSSPAPYRRIADDFTVGGSGWYLAAVVTYAYETNVAVPSWTGFNANIWDGRPGDAGSGIVATSSDAVIEFSGAYRVFNGAANLGNTQRPVYTISFDFGGQHLPAGEYWFDWQVEGGSSAWTVFVMEPDAEAPNDPVTVVGNARHLTPDGWQDVLADPRPGAPAEIPFVVTGSTSAFVVGGSDPTSRSLSAAAGSPLSGHGPVTPSTRDDDRPRD